MNAQAMNNSGIKTIAMTIPMVVGSYFVFSNVMLTGRNGVYNHANKAYMALLMGTFMGSIDSFYNKKYINGAIFTASSAILIAMIRKQYLVSDKQFAKGMIEHHDMALLMAEKIKEKTDNPEIIKLADDILKNQQKEIDLMETWIK